MSSWYNLAKGFTDKVASVVTDDSLLEKLTLTTPELTAQRRALDESERRKEHVRHMLAGMLPWETRDAERDILVEECRDAILQLSQSKDTFFGPYQMPKSDAKTTEDDEDDGDDDDDAAAKKQKQEIPPSPESLEKLSKLEPLPPLLQNFDFNAHVGLIEKILAQDPALVQQQSHWSGGGARERVFWRNYFFHCAYTRYEAGLSIDEIWGDMTEEERAAAARKHSSAKQEKEEQLLAASAAVNKKKEDEHHPDEETITFHEDESDGAKGKEQKQQHQPTNTKATAAAATDSAEGGESSYEMVEGGDGAAAEGEDHTADDEVVGDNKKDGTNASGGAGGEEEEEDDDYELDELEAEILRELED